MKFILCVSVSSEKVYTRIIEVNEHCELLEINTSNIIMQLKSTDVPNLLRNHGTFTNFRVYV